MTSHYTYAVIGGGIEGSATAYYLAKNGFKTVLLEQFRPGHTRGSSHGNSRITRKAYAEPVYVEMMQRAYPLWQELESEVGEQLYKRTGMIHVGVNTGRSVNRISLAMSAHKAPYTVLNSEQLLAKYPQLKFDSNWQAVYDESGGLLKADRCLNAFQTQFIKYGGHFHYNDAVISIQAGEIISLTAASGRQYTCDGLVICVGTWAGTFLNEKLGLKLPLQPRVVKSCYWKVEQTGLYSIENGFPCIICSIESNQRNEEIYCLPSDEYRDMVKICSHEGVPISHPDERDSIDASLYIQKAQNFITEHFKHVQAKPAIVETCMYTMTPDEHCILDTHPQYENIVIGAGFSGHGFKLASVVGEVLGSLLLKRPTFDLSLFSIGRFKGAVMKGKL